MNVKEGCLIRALKPFRVGLGAGPDRNGLCAKGDLFYVLDVYCPCEDDMYGDAEIEVLAVTETVRSGYPRKTFIAPENRGEYWVLVRL